MEWMDCTPEPLLRHNEGLKKICMVPGPLLCWSDEGIRLRLSLPGVEYDFELHSLSRESPGLSDVQVTGMARIGPG